MFNSTHIEYHISKSWLIAAVSYWQSVKLPTITTVPWRKIEPTWVLLFSLNSIKVFWINLPQISLKYLEMLSFFNKLPLLYYLAALRQTLSYCLGNPLNPLVYKSDATRRQYNVTVLSLQNLIMINSIWCHYSE